MSLRGPPDERTPAELLGFGVVNLDKPPGPSSHEVADWVKAHVQSVLERVDPEADNVDRVAHAGTLDPKVTGSLPMLLGDATRVAQVFDESIKEYIAVLELHGPLPADFEATFAEFEGERYTRNRPERAQSVVGFAHVRFTHSTCSKPESARCSCGFGVRPGRTSESSVTTSDWRSGPAHTWGTCAGARRARSTTRRS